MSAEWQFDGLVGPTHNYAGLAFGNVASANNAGAISNPRAAALQGLSKMRFVCDLGIPQALLPPHYRPRLDLLRALGFGGNRAKLLEDAAREAPQLLASVYSSAFMWAANAATVTPSADSADGRVHFSIANLMSHYHRASEADFTYRSFCKIFHNQNQFVVHNALMSSDLLCDEGAANHMVLSRAHGAPGFHLFVYGKSGADPQKPKLFPARQHRVAFESIARRHGIVQNRTLFLQQSPDAIDAGVFHNDVIALSTCDRMIVHEHAFIDAHRQQLLKAAENGQGWRVREVRADELSLAEAVKTYLFNSQYLRLPDGSYVLVVPQESAESQQVSALLHTLISEGFVDAIHPIEVRESMRNGGGPACLRLRVVLTPDQATQIHSGIVMTDACCDAISGWVRTHYRDRLSFDDLRDPSLVDELNRAYLELESILNLPGLYSPWMEQ